MTRAQFSKDTLKILRNQYFRGKMSEEDVQNILFEPYGETVASFRVLTYLLNHEEGVEPSVIADDLYLLRQSITSIADQLEKKNYVERHNHPTDRRKILLRITDVGKVKTAELMDAFYDYHARITAHFTKQELDDFFSMRDRLYDVRAEVIKEITDERK